jgi:hypothetical protein
LVSMFKAHCKSVKRGGPLVLLDIVEKDDP